MTENINLAALWIPVMPETSQIKPTMEKAGSEAVSSFVKGAKSASGSSGSGGGIDQVGADLGSQLAKAAREAFTKEDPFKLGTLFDAYASKGDPQLIAQLQSKMAESTKSYSAALQEFTTTGKAAADAQNLLNEMHKQGGFGAFQLLDAQSKLNAANKEHIAATEQMKAATENYNTSQNKLHESTQQVSGSSVILAGILGGAVTGGINLVVQGFEKFIELGAEVFEKAVEGAEELAHKLVEVGEGYEGIEHKIELFTGATGEHLEALNQSAAKVFAGMDSDSRTLGQDISILAQRLNAEAGPALETLTSHVEMLKDRFGSLDMNALTSSFTNFGVEGAEHADEALASLTKSAQSAGTSVDEVVKAVGASSRVLADAGLTMQQAGGFASLLIQQGISAQTVMTGLQSAQTVFSKQGLAFKEGMAEAAQEIQHYVDIGDRVDADALGQKLFGTRRWEDALHAVQDFNEVVAAQPGMYDANGQSLDELGRKTQSLGNKWDEVKHHIEDALRPAGLEAVTMIGNAFNTLEQYITTHHDQIAAKIKDLGNQFIAALPAIQQFAVETLRVLGPVFDFIDIQVGLVVFQLGLMMKGIALAAGTLGGPLAHLIPGYDRLVKASNELGDFGTKAGKSLADLKVTPGMDALSDKIAGLNVDTKGLTTSWGELADKLNTSITPQIDTSKMFPGVGNASSPGLFGDSGGAPGAAPSGDTSQQGIANLIAAAAQRHGYPPEAIQAILATAIGESSLNPMATGGIQGVAGHPATEADRVWGLFQQKASWGTVAERQDPTHNVEAFLNALDKQGSGDIWSRITSTQRGPAASYYQNYLGPAAAFMGAMKSGVAPPSAAPTPVAPVDNQAAAQPVPVAAPPMPLDTSTMPTPSVPVTMPGDEQGVVPGIIDIEGIANQFGLKLTAGKSGHGTHDIDKGYHDTGQAGDFGGGTADQMEGFAEYMEKNFGPQLLELIHTDPRLTQLVKNGKLVDPQQVYGPWLAGHKDHVHIAIEPNWTPVGAAPGDGSMPTTKGGMPGLPGQYGGYGAYDAETMDTMRNDQKAVKNAKDRLADMDWSQGQKQQAVTDLQTEINNLQASQKTGLLADPNINTQIAAKQKELLAAQHDLVVGTRERADQVDAITDAERKQQEDMFKSPKGTKTTKDQKVTGEAAFEQLGGGLMKGIAQELGLGDIFGKPPWEWGIFKLGAAMVNWGVGTANAWAGQIGAGKTGIGGPGWGNNSGTAMPGWDAQSGSGSSALGALAKGLGMPDYSKIAQARNVSAGPNLSDASQVPGPGFGAPPGPAPGPNGFTVNQFGVKDGPQEFKPAYNAIVNGAGVPQG